jgi:hypothetical protein
MYKNYLLCLFLFLVLGKTVSAQTVVSPVPTTTTFLSGASGITFNLENTNAGPIIVTGVDMYMDVASSGATYTLWYTTSALSGTSTVNTPTWTQIATNTPAAISASGVYPIFTGLTFNMPGTTTYRFCVVSSNRVDYGSAAPGNTATAGGVSLRVGDFQIAAANVGYAGSGANPSLANTPRWFYGSVTFMPAAPCVAPPTPGNPVASSTNVCSGGNLDLTLSGNSFGTGQTYQWQSGPSATGPWTNIGTASGSPSISLNPTATMWYRAGVTCSGNTQYTPTPIQVTVPGLFPGGTYTINSAVATGGTNFQSFTAAVDAIKCGIAGPVTFNVAAGSGPYNQKITIPHSATFTSTNTVTFNGNGAIITTVGAASGDNTITLNGADFIRFNNLKINNTGTTGYCVWLTNNADNNTFDGCTMETNLTATGSASSVMGVGCANTSTTTSGTGDCDNNVVSNCTLIGGYTGISFMGTASTINTGNKLLNCIVRDQYVYRNYALYQNGLVIKGNDMFNTTARATHSTFYGPMITTGCTKSLIDANKVHDPAPNGLTGTSTIYCLYAGADGTVGNENVFSNNIVYNIRNNGSHYGIYNTSSDYALYYYNSVTLDYTAATAGLAYGFYQITAATGIQLKNNIISVTKGGTGAMYPMFFNTTGTTYTLDRNNYYMASASTGAKGIGSLFGTPHTTIAAWATAASDPNSKSINPLFADATTGNLKPTEPTLDNLGLPITGITTDILGNTRSTTTPDIGAFEFSVIPCPAPAGLSAGTPTATGANLTWSASLNSIGYEYAVTTSATPPATGTATTATNFAATGLNPGTTYYLHVRSKCDPTTFSPWATLSFNTVCPAPPTPSITAIGLNGATATWTAVTGATGYQYFVSTSLTPPASGTATTATTFNPSGLDDATTYYVHVRTKCQGTIFSSWTTTSFTTLACTPPATPSITGVTYSGANVSWNVIGGALGYEYELSNSTTPPSAGTATTATSFSASGLNVSTTYYVHVRTKCNATTYSNWVTTSFTTTTSPCAAPSTSPAVTGVTHNSANINWPVVTGAASYEYALTNSSIPPTSGTLTTANNYNPATLTPATTYYIHVRTICGPSTLYSAWVTSSFTTLYAPCPDPIVSVTNIDYTSADISWNATGALDYEYVINTDPGSPTAGTTTTSTTYSATGLLPATTYYMHIRSRCVGSTRSPWINVSFSTLTCATVTPVLSNVDFTTADITWASSTGSVGYEYAVTLNSTPPATGIPTNSNSYNATNLMPNTTYYMHMRSLCQTGAYSVWTTISFNTMGCDKPNAPTVSNIGYGNAEVSWSKVAGVSGYEYAVTNDGYLPIITVNTGDTKVKVSDLAMATTYNFHIRTVCMGGYKSPWEVTVFRTKDHPTNVSDVNKGVSIEAYPNPTRDMVTVRLNGIANAGGEMMLTDMAGRVLKTVKVNAQETVVDMNQFAPGIYMLKYIDAENNSHTLRITKQ